MLLNDKAFRLLRKAAKGSAFGNRELFVKSSIKNFCSPQTFLHSKKAMHQFFCSDALPLVV